MTYWYCQSCQMPTFLHSHFCHIDECWQSAILSFEFETVSFCLNSSTQRISSFHSYAWRTFTSGLLTIFWFSVPFDFAALQMIAYYSKWYYMKTALYIQKVLGVEVKKKLGAFSLHTLKMIICRMTFTFFLCYQNVVFSRELISLRLHSCLLPVSRWKISFLFSSSIV